MPLDATGARRWFIEGFEDGKRVAVDILAGRDYTLSCVPTVIDHKLKYLEGVRKGIAQGLKEEHMKWGTCWFGNHRDCAVRGCPCRSKDHHAGQHGCPTCGDIGIVEKVSKSGFDVEVWPCPGCRREDYDQKKAATP